MNEKQVYFVINSISLEKSGIDIPRIIRKKLLRHKNVKFDLLYTRYKGHAEIITQSLIIKKPYAIVAVGGDGTINEVAKYLINKNINLGIIPLGSGNGLSNHLGISRNISNAIATLLQNNPVCIDVGFVNDIPFFSNAGFALEAIFIKFQENNRKRGLTNYVFAFLKAWKSFKPFYTKIKLDNSEKERKVFVFSVFNSNQYGYNVKTCKDAQLDDGLLNVLIVSAGNKFKALINIMKYLVGVKCNNKNVISTKVNCAEIWIENPYFQVDGERKQVNNPIKVSVQASSLRVLVTA